MKLENEKNGNHHHNFMPEEKSQPKVIIQKGSEGKSASFGYGGVSKAIAFIKETLGKEGDVVKAVRTSDGGWEIEVEVIEQSEYMKRIGISKPIYDKNIYRVILDKDSNVTSYERKAQKPSGSPQE